jgi:serine/threonine-protein kinase RsbW
MSADEVRLAVPAAPEYARIARLTVSGLATRLGFTYDEVEDLRIAVGEACSLLLGPGGREGTLTLVYGLSPDAIAIEAIGDFTDGDADDRTEAAGLTDQILTAVVDEHEVDDAGWRVRLVKRRAGG